MGVIVLVLVILAAIFLFRREGYLSKEDIRKIEEIMIDFKKNGGVFTDGDSYIIKSYIENPSDVIRSKFVTILNNKGLGEIIEIVDNAEKPTSIGKSGNNTKAGGAKAQSLKGPGLGSVIEERVPEKFHCERIGKNYVCNFN